MAKKRVAAKRRMRALSATISKRGLMVKRGL